MDTNTRLPISKTPRTDFWVKRIFPWTLPKDHEAIQSFRLMEDCSRDLEIENTELAEALQHCVNVFGHMANRGAYPEELLSDEIRGDGEKHFMGKQGFMFAVLALRKREKSIAFSKK